MFDQTSIPRHRLDALVDAVLAITMTLLVLELRLPDQINGDLLAAIGGLRPKIISWVVSFLILALCWHNHVNDFRRVETIDNRIFWLVVLWLLATSLIPFTSSLIGEHDNLLDSHIVYAANIIAIQVLIVLRNLHLRCHPELFAKGEGFDMGWSTAGIASLCALASIAIALASPSHASMAYILMWPLSALSRHLRRAQ